MDNKRKYLLLLLILILISVLGYIFFTKNKEEEAIQEDTNVQQDYTDSKSLNDEEEVVEHNLEMSIISPVEDTFSVRQARMYEALIEGNGKYSNQVKCHWEFFLNENNEEVLYKTMDNTGILSGESKEICGFTSTFIESKGVLRVKLTVTVFDAVNENIESISAERTYTVL